MLASSIDANTLYYHQELGKYNLLKKRECHLSCVYNQLQSRMKLWIFKERIRLIEWEVNEANIFKAERDTLEIELKKVIHTRPRESEELMKRNRTYQLIDICQCHDINYRPDRV